MLVIPKRFVILLSQMLSKILQLIHMMDTSLQLEGRMFLYFRRQEQHSLGANHQTHYSRKFLSDKYNHLLLLLEYPPKDMFWRCMSVRSHNRRY